MEVKVFNKFDQHTRILGKDFFFFLQIAVCFPMNRVLVGLLGSWHYTDMWEALGKKGFLDMSLVQFLGQEDLFEKG